ncbi:MAG: glycosyltransferase family 4 protein [Egibacteraceae bacterium]
MPEPVQRLDHRTATAASRRRLRIAHLCTIDMSLAWLLSRELTFDIEAGHEVIGLSASGPYVAQIEALGVRHVPVPAFTRSWSPRGDLLAARQLWRLLRALDLDVLHTHQPKSGVLGRILGRAAGIPVVVNTCHGLWVRPDDGLAKKALVYAAETVAAWCSHAELYQSDDDRRTLRWAVPQGRARTVGNGIDLHRFAPDPQGRARVRRELGIGDDAVLVGGVGRCVAEKGLVEFITAAGSLSDLAAFVWVGPEDLDKPDRLVEESGVVRFLGERDDMPAVYSALDIFVLPSHREGFSRSAMEAAACGTALVLSDIRGCREIGTHERELLLVPPRDAVALGAAIRRFIDDAALRERLAERARQRAHVTFDQRAIAAISLETYCDVGNRKGLTW